MFEIYILLLLSLAFALTSIPGPSVTDENWKMPLSKKAELFEQNLLEKHWIDGLYASIVEILPDGSVDHNTTGWSNVAHSSSWSGNYLAGQAYRYAFTKDEKVRQHCQEILMALRRLQRVTGVPGLVARGYHRGHGPSYEERSNVSTVNEWHQGAAELSNYRWRGHPSHHNYDDVMHGYGVYYDLAANEEQKEIVKEDVYNIMSYILENDMKIKEIDGRIVAEILGITDGKTPNTRIVMATSSLKTAYHITEDEKFNAKYLQLIEQYGYRKYGKLSTEEMVKLLRLRIRAGHDDAEHVLGDLDNMFRQEKDPELLAFYRKVLDALWEVHKDDRQSLYNYIYLALTPKSPDKEKARFGALRTLQEYPTNKIFRPKLNSIRADIKFVTDESGQLLSEIPLPIYERPLDNEYEWKTNPYKLDGWLARGVVSLETSEDPMVMYAVDDAGVIYLTVDAGKSWKEVSKNLGANARHLIVSNRRMRIAFVATDRGIFKTTDAGNSWKRVYSGLSAAAARYLLADPNSDNVIYAIMEDGIYKSVDLGEEWLGEQWKFIGGGLPPASDLVYGIYASEPHVLYAASGEKVFKKLRDQDWMLVGQTPYPGVRIKSLLVDPKASHLLYSICSYRYANRDWRFILKSSNGGKSWDLAMGKSIYSLLPGSPGSELGLQGDVESIAIDPKDSSILYAATTKGVFKSTDAASSWQAINSGLSIQKVSAVFAPLGKSIYVSTPGGLFESSDGGKSWKEGNLTIIGRGLVEETGSADFLDAYWMGRYFGFISQAEADADK